MWLGGACTDTAECSGAVHLCTAYNAWVRRVRQGGCLGLDRACEEDREGGRDRERERARSDLQRRQVLPFPLGDRRVHPPCQLEMMAREYRLWIAVLGPACRSEGRIWGLRGS